MRLIKSKQEEANMDLNNLIIELKDGKIKVAVNGEELLQITGFKLNVEAGKTPELELKLALENLNKEWA